MTRTRGWLVAAIVCLAVLPAAARQSPPVRTETGPAPSEVMETFMKASTGNVADAVDEATGLRGFMARDMKPVFKAKVIGPAVGGLLREGLRNGKWAWPSPPIQSLGGAPPRSAMGTG